MPSKAPYPTITVIILNGGLWSTLLVWYSTAINILKNQHKVLCSFRKLTWLSYQVYQWWISSWYSLISILQGIYKIDIFLQKCSIIVFLIYEIAVISHFIVYSISNGVQIMHNDVPSKIYNSFDKMTVMCVKLRSAKRFLKYFRKKWCQGIK